MSAQDMEAILSDPRNLRRWHQRLQRYTEPDACWIWGRHVYKRGSFCVFLGGERKQIIASRMSLLVKLGRPFEGLACHDCDRPGCVNPSHIWEGTHLDNIQDAVTKSRIQSPAKLQRLVDLRRESVDFCERRLADARVALAEAQRALAVCPSVPQQQRPILFGFETEELVLQ